MTIEYDNFLTMFENSDSYPVDETEFYFDDDKDEKMRYIGCLEEYEKPYWAGYCDIENGCEFKTAKELFEAKIYNGKSLKERWKNVVVFSISGISFAEWMEHYCK